ncbi:MAG TPA: cytochrome c biogenesis protein/redoxin [Candidatus Sulfotelmatobacter sp.]|jgi:cytochrome c-type biogenesis protein
MSSSLSSLPLPLAAFVAGLISFLSPCVLPLVPGYVSMISGAALDELKAASGDLRRRVLINSVAFILGFSVVFIALGAAATEVGQALGQYRSILAREAGILIILFGLHMTGLVTIKALYTDARLHNVKGGSTMRGSFAIGFAFAFGWTPCVGPILSVILGFASAEASALKGILLLAAYSLGLAVPFMITSLGLEQFLSFYSRFRRHMHIMEVASGAILIALGHLLVFDRFTLISSQLSFLGRFETWLEGVVTHSSVTGIILVTAAVALVLYLALRPGRRAIAPTPATPSVTTDAGATQDASDATVPNSLPESAPSQIARGRNPLALVAAALVAAGMIYFGVHMARRPSPPQAAAQASPAPDFTLESLDGKNLSLSDLRGKAVLLNFWATWCGPCKIETPWLVELQNKYGAQGLQVIGVAMDDSGKDDIAKFAKDMGMNYPVLLGKEAVGDAYGGVPALPESFFIGRDGKIVDKIVGLRGKAEIEDSIKMALGTQSGNAKDQNDAAPLAAAQPQN